MPDVFGVLALVVAFGAVIAWMVRREERRRRARAEAEALAAWMRSPAFEQFRADVVAVGAAIGEAMLPAIQRTTEAIAAFGRALGEAMNEAGLNMTIEEWASEVERRRAGEMPQG